MLPTSSGWGRDRVRVAFGNSHSARAPAVLMTTYDRKLLNTESGSADLSASCLESLTPRSGYNKQTSLAQQGVAQQGGLYWHHLGGPGTHKP